MGRQALIVKMSGVWICVSGESAHFAFQGLLRLFVFSWFRVFVRCDMRLGSTEPLNFDFLLDVTVILAFAASRPRARRMPRIM